MPFDGSGNFNRVMNWVNDAVAGIKIKSDRHDQEDNNFASGLSNTLTKDGQSQPTADIPLNGKRLINVGAPTGPADAVTKAYTDAKLDFATTGVPVPGSGSAASIRFADADIGFGTRKAENPAGTVNRFVWNDKPDLSGADVATLTEVGAFNVSAAFIASGAITGTPTVGAKGAASGNVHLWLYGPAGEDRGVIYTTSATQTAVILRVGGTQSFTFGTDGRFTAPSTVYVGSALLSTDGNLQGSIWDNFGAHDAYTAINTRIESRAQAWAINYANACVQSTRVAGYVVYNPAVGGDGGMTNSGYFCTMAQRQSSDKYVFGFRQLQIYIPSQGWVQATAW